MGANQEQIKFKNLLQVRSRDLYRRRTKAEDMLWLRLKAKRLDGLKFRCQRKIPPYIVDFVCMEKHLIIELDGSSHDGREGYDARRTRILELRGYRVIRFRNEDVFNDIEEVLDCISWELLKSPAGIKKAKRNRALAMPISIGKSEVF